MAAERSHGKKGNEELDCMEVTGEPEPNGGGAVCLMEPETVDAEAVNAETMDLEMLHEEIREQMEEI